MFGCPSYFPTSIPVQSATEPQYCAHNTVQCCVKRRGDQPGGEGGGTAVVQQLWSISSCTAHPPSSEAEWSEESRRGGDLHLAASTSTQQGKLQSSEYTSAIYFSPSAQIVLVSVCKLIFDIFCQPTRQTWELSKSWTKQGKILITYLISLS